MINVGYLKMRDILIIAPFTRDIDMFKSDRFHFIADELSHMNVSVELITSSFSHLKKEHRKINKKTFNGIDYKVTMLYEPGYKENIGIDRLISHYKFSKSLNEYLKKRKKADVIYCAVPPLDSAMVAATYAKLKMVPFIIDIQDLWPEAFEMIFNVPVIKDILFYPIYRKSNYVYSSADMIIAVSKTYADRALSVNKRCVRAEVVFLGTDLEYFDMLGREKSILDKTNNEIWIVYIGTLGHSYNIKNVIDAIGLIKDRFNVRFIVMGDGPLKNKFEDYARQKNVPAIFTGWLERSSMIGILKVCDIAVNPIRHGAAGSIINKHADYAAAGLPILNTQECAEYVQLIQRYNAGMNCKCDDAKDLAEKMEQLCKNRALRENMSQNSRRLAEAKFNRRKTYKIITELILNIK